MLVCSTDRAAVMLDVTPQHIRQLVNRGVLRSVKLPQSRSVRIPLADIYAAAGLEMPEGGPDAA